jgi:hypothetical protein
MIKAGYEAVWGKVIDGITQELTRCLGLCIKYWKGSLG